MPTTPFPVEVAATSGEVPADVLALAEQKVRHVARRAPAPVLFARVAVAHDEDLPTHRPDHYPRPPEQREIVRRRSRELPHASVEEAALDLELLDQDWILFAELDTGHDAVLARRHSGYTLELAGDRPLLLDRLTVDVGMGPPVPTMALHDAIEALVAGGLPFVFFVAADTGRGEVVYLRHHGHYGVVVPAEPALATS